MEKEKMNITKIYNNICTIECDCGEMLQVHENDEKAFCGKCGVESTTSILVRKFYESGMNGQWQLDVAERKQSVRKKFLKKYPDLLRLASKMKKRDPHAKRVKNEYLFINDSPMSVLLREGSGDV